MSKTITLDSPIKRGDIELDRITIIKPAGTAWMRGVKLTDLLQMDTVALATVLPRITEPALTGAEINAKLDPADLLQIGAEVASFLLPKSALPTESQLEWKTPGPTLQ